MTPICLYFFGSKRAGWSGEYKKALWVSSFEKGRLSTCSGNCAQEVIDRTGTNISVCLSALLVDRLSSQTNTRTTQNDLKSYSARMWRCSNSRSERVFRWNDVTFYWVLLERAVSLLLCAASALYITAIGCYSTQRVLSLVLIPESSVQPAASCTMLSTLLISLLAGPIMAPHWKYL